VREFSANEQGKSWKRVSKDGANIEALSLEQRHDLRKALKDFRYTAEFFGSLYDASRVAGFVKELKKLQDVFGYVNDAATAKALNPICHERCRESAEAQRAAGYVLGWHDAQAGHAWNCVPKAWDRLKKRARFWD